VGYYPNATKVALVPNVAAQQFRITALGSSQVVFSGDLSPAAVWEPAADTVKQADFSRLTQPGQYQLWVTGIANPAPITISAKAYEAINSSSLKAYYFNRAGTALSATHAGPYQRPAGHPDTRVKIHSSAASGLRPTGFEFAASKGWYDAGDYNKYVVNSGISTYSLLAAYESFPEVFAQQNNNIPESNNTVPDILDEALWNLEWLLAMQDPNDGGVYHKLTSKNFTGFAMPHTDATERFVVMKTTTATLNLAAVMAVASRVYSQYPQQFPGLSQKMLAAARSAFAWAQANPQVLYLQPADIVTGEYGDKDASDEMAWAAAELYITTREASYYSAIKLETLAATVPWWGDVSGLAWISLARHSAQLPAGADKDLIRLRLDNMARGLASQQAKSAYGVAMQTADFTWGSNAVVLNQAMVLLAAYQQDTSQKAYLTAAQAQLDYILGRNATDYSFVTGWGQRYPQNIHHRPSGADTVPGAIPGFVVGGPQPGQEDAQYCGNLYPSKLPAKSYVDAQCSYASNEIAINWNAPFVYTTAALQRLYQQP
jgi:endoglucanase